MPEMNVEDFKFPDEKQESQEQEEQFEVEIEDDTPSEDRRREPMPKPLIEELEQDELDQYDEGVKQKLKQMRKVWHDERREKETALREQQEAIELAQKVHG
jgi:mono/diheme cytochrome c family protein